MGPAFPPYARNTTSVQTSISVVPKSNSKSQGRPTAQLTGLQTTGSRSCSDQTDYHLKNGFIYGGRSIPRDSTAGLSDITESPSVLA